MSDEGGGKPSMTYYSDPSIMILNYMSDCPSVEHRVTTNEEPRFCSRDNLWF